MKKFSLFFQHSLEHSAKWLKSVVAMVSHKEQYPYPNAYPNNKVSTTTEDNDGMAPSRNGYQGDEVGNKL